MNNDSKSSTCSVGFPWRRWILFVLLTISFVGTTFLVWNLWNHGIELEETLRKTEHKRQLLSQKLTVLHSQTDGMRAATDSAEMRAANAEVKAAHLDKARQRAELERELVRETAERYRGESVEARHEAERARTEAARIRRQRETELDRMRDALSRIVETERTPMGMIMNLEEDSFLFDFDESVIRSENREILSRIAGVLLASHGYRLYIYGHTDDVGSAGYNRNLSDRRARAVRNYLVDAGVPQEVVETTAFGESSPAIKGPSANAHQKNRRVEIGVIDTVVHYTESFRD
jgi:outer membrane protein OmpA-like peptidoglycan-associated protein